MSAAQSAFLRDVGHLIAWAFENGYELTLGEGYRTKDQQWLYYNGKTLVGGRIMNHPQGRLSWTTNSRHMQRLAIDFNLFIDGDWQTTTEAYRPLGEFWESLNTKNRWGVIKANGGRSDGNHFERLP